MGLDYRPDLDGLKQVYGPNCRTPSKEQQKPLPKNSTLHRAADNQRIPPAITDHTTMKGQS